MRIPFGPWEPDAAGVDSGRLEEARNVFATPIGYKPIPALASLSDETLPSRCIGLTFARTTDGSHIVFAGTATGLYKLVAGEWVDYSGSTYSVPDGDYWSFAQFGSLLIAVNLADDPQVIDVDSVATAFSNLGGSPPKARYVGVVGDFVFLASLAENQRKLIHSAINNATGWTVGTDLCDEQTFPEGGSITGLASGEFGYVTQETSIRRVIFQPGADVAFRFEQIDKERGCVTPYGLVAVAGSIFFQANDGFYAFSGGSLLPIGAARVNDWFRVNSDQTKAHLSLGFSDPAAPRIYWAYYSPGGLNYFSGLLIYDWKLDRWTHGAVIAQFWATFATPGYTLEELDAFGTLETLPYSLDSRVWQGGRPVIAGVDLAGELAYLEGAAPLDAYIKTHEFQLLPGYRAKINEGVTPVGVWNAANILINVYKREHTGQAQTVQANIAPSTLTGRARFVSSGRLHQLEFSITQASGTMWEHAQGFDVDAARDGLK